MALLLGTELRPLASVPSIDAKTVASTPLYTVPAGKKACITHVVVRVTSATAITVPATAQVETVATTQNIFASQVLTGVLALNDRWTFSSAAKSIMADSGTTISLNITVGATGTTQLVSADLIGYIV